jgi:glycerol-3-phosphate dehydrogenase
VSLDELTVRLERAGLDAPLAERYARLYGGEADAVLPDGDAISGEVRQAVRREGALTLADYWFRRSGRAFFDEHRDGSLEAASQAMQGLMGWSEPTRLAEVERCRQLCRRSLEAIAAT